MQNQPLVANYDLTLTPQEMQIIVSSLAEQQFKVVGNLIPKIMEQCQNQEDAAQKAIADLPPA